MKREAVQSKNEAHEDSDEGQDKDEFIEIKVGEPHKVGEGMSSFLVYPVVTRTNVTFFKSNESSVERRFSDFLSLHARLSEKYLQNGRIIPPAPDKSLVGMTKVKMDKTRINTTNDDNNNNNEENNNGATKGGLQDEFVERRRAALERFLNRTASHPSLRTDPDFRDFLETQNGLPRSINTSALSGKNVMRLLGKVTDRVSSMALKMEENDEWFQEKSHVLDELESQLRRLHNAADQMADHRRHLSLSAGALSRALMKLSECEKQKNEALASALNRLGSAEEKMETIHEKQHLSDLYLVAEIVKDHLALLGAVRDAFQERIKAWQHWQATTSSLNKKRELKAKAELMQRVDKINQLRQEIAELEQQQEMAQENFERISRVIKKEVEAFDLSRQLEFKKCLISYMRDMLNAQEDVARIWQTYLQSLGQQP